MLVVAQVSMFVPVVLFMAGSGTEVFWVIFTLEIAEHPLAPVTNKL